VAVQYSEGLVIARSQVGIASPVTVYQCQLSIPSLQGWLMTITISVVLQLWLVSCWELIKQRSEPHYGLMRLCEVFAIYISTYCINGDCKDLW